MERLQKQTDWSTYMELHNITTLTTAIRENIEKVIIGKSDTINLVMTTLLAKGHILLEDAPGTGKTVLAKTLSKSINADFSRIQFTPDLLPSDITGLNYYNQKEGEFLFRPGPVFTNILLADEINRATPRTQSSLLECMEERQITIDGETHILKPPFFVIATQNPIETAGTFPLPEAQLDRFMMKISVGFPTLEEELRILNRFIQGNPLEELLSVCRKEELLAMQNLIASIYVHPSVMEYMLTLIHSTRNHKSIVLGVSPRGSLALLKASQAYCAVMGRDYVTPEDIKYLAPYVLSHRMVLHGSYDSHFTAENYIEEILNLVPVPTEDFTNK